MPLSTTGMWQVGRLVDRLAATRDDERIDIVIASDLARTWLTAQPLAERLALELRPEPRLRERDFGRFQGHTLEEIAARWPEDFARWRERDPAWTIPSGESGQQFGERVLAALAEIARDHAGQRVVVVTHGGVLDVAYRHAHALAWDAPRHHLMLNCSINRVNATAAPLALQIIDWGDVAHLQGARDELPT